MVRCTAKEVRECTTTGNMQEKSSAKLWQLTGMTAPQNMMHTWSKYCTGHHHCLAHEFSCIQPYSSLEDVILLHKPYTSTVQSDNYIFLTFLSGETVLDSQLENNNLNCLTGFPSILFCKSTLEPIFKYDL